MENQKFYVSFWLNPNRQKDGAAKLYIRIAIDGKRSKIATTHYIKKMHWDAAKGRVKNSSPQAVLINSFIDHASNVIQKQGR